MQNRICKFRAWDKALEQMQYAEKGDTFLITAIGEIVSNKPEDYILNSNAIHRPLRQERQRDL